MYASVADPYMNEKTDRKSENISGRKVLDVLFRGLKASPTYRTSYMAVYS